MAKMKTKTTRSKSSFDTMSVTVLLVMAIFGGLVGFYLGRGASTPQAVSLREAGVLMKEKGTMMEDAGRLMSDKGKQTNDREMMDKGQMMMDSGSQLFGKGSTMMGMTEGY